MSSTIESVLQEKRVFPPAAEFVKQANVSGMEGYRKLYAEAERDFEGFWGRMARETLLWHKPFTQVLDESKAPERRAGVVGRVWRRCSRAQPSRRSRPRPGSPGRGRRPRR